MYKSLEDIIIAEKEKNLPFWKIVMQEDCVELDISEEESFKRMKRMYEVMKESDNAYEDNLMSRSGLVGTDGKKVHDARLAGKLVCGDFVGRVIERAIKMGESNACMKRIVAAPTAGSAGVIPGAVLSVCEDYNLGEDAIYSGLLNASALGYIVMRNASVSGAEAGCQAEVGAASAMAASAIVELLGGTPDQCLHAASIAFSNLLGLVCDPIAGLVESPCQSRNAIGVSNAFTSAQLALAGVKHPIPFDEMVEAMYKVGLSLPFELRETALGGCAATPTGCELCKKCIG